MFDSEHVPIMVKVETHQADDKLANYEKLGYFRKSRLGKKKIEVVKELGMPTGAQYQYFVLGIQGKPTAHAHAHPHTNPHTHIHTVSLCTGIQHPTHPHTHPPPVKKC
jgi:hypothetical protein